MNCRVAELFPQRQQLYHNVPAWVSTGAAFFITIVCAERGKPQLTLPAVAQLIIQSVERLHNEERWFCHLFLLMPDHLHAILAFPPEAEMTKVIARFKSFQARRHGIHWQDGFFDHRIRNDAEFQDRASYIRRNPVRAGLVADPDDWKFVWSLR